jgi:hypothetical protein
MDHPTITQLSVYALKLLCPDETSESEAPRSLSEPELADLAEVDSDIEELSFDDLIQAVQADLAAKR